MLASRSEYLPLVFPWPGFLAGQEIKYIDIASVPQRTKLRTPPAPQPDCKEGTHRIGGGYGDGGVADGAPD